MQMNWSSKPEMIVERDAWEGLRGIRYKYGRAIRYTSMRRGIENDTKVFQLN